MNHKNEKEKNKVRKKKRSEINKYNTTRASNEGLHSTIN